MLSPRGDVASGKTPLAVVAGLRVSSTNGDVACGVPPALGRLLLSPKIPSVAIFPKVGLARLIPPVKMAVAIFDDTYRLLYAW